MSETSNIVILRTGSGYLFRVEGRGTLRESAAVREFVCGAIENGDGVVLDLSECEYLDSTFLGCIVIMHQRGEIRSGSFAVFADASVRQNLLSVSRLERLLSFVDERPVPVGDPVSLRVGDMPRLALCQHLIETHAKLADLGGPSAETFRKIVEQLRKELDSASH